MKEFLLQNNRLLTLIIETIPALTGIILLNRYKDTFVKYFIYFLIYVVILVEFIGGYPRVFVNYEFLNSFVSFIRGTVFERNYWWYTIFWFIGSALFFSFYYQKKLSNNNFRKTLKYITSFFIISSLLYMIIYWSDFYSAFSNYINFFSTGIILLCVIFYFIELLQNDTIIEFNKSILFYISIALLIWLLITTPIAFYNIYFRAEDWNFVILQWQIYLFSNFFLYGMFTFALIWCRPKKV